MTNCLVLLVDTDDRSPLARVAEEAASGLGFDFQCVDAQPGALEHVVGEQRPLSLLLAPKVPKPLVLARRLRRRWPSAQIIFIAPDSASGFRAELDRGGLRGGNWMLLAPDSADFEARLSAALSAAQRRHAFRDTRDRLNARLLGRTPHLAPDLRRLVQSGHYLANILDTAPDSIVLLDDQATIVAWNKGAHALFGYTEAAALGQSIDFLMQEKSDEQRVSGVLARVRAGEAVVRQELRCATATGAVRDVEFTAADLADEIGRRVGFSVIARDVTERKRDQALLAAERERLAVTLNSIGDGVITTDVRGRVTALNKVAEKLTGWPRQEALGQPLGTVFRIIDEKTREPREDPVSKVLRLNEIVLLANHTALIAKDGTERSIADSGAPIRDKNSEVIGVVLVFRDVTEKQRTEEALRKMRQLESIGVLAGGIAHDFNNILTALFGNIALVKLHAGHDPVVADLLGRTEHAFLRARDLTQQLLTFAKGGAPIKKAGSIGDLVREASRFVLLGTNVKADFDIANDLWTVEFDAGQLSQAVNNIVINARQAMPEGGTVTIRAANVALKKNQAPPLTPGRYVRLTIADHGIGIAQPHLEKIFDPYFTTKQQGSGLGLATTYSIVRRHGGTVMARSVLGHGAEFDIYLPATQSSSPAPTASAPLGIPGGSGLVLLMDDEAAVREVGGEILRRLGYEVRLAKDGDELLGLYRAALSAGTRPVAVIVDLTVPGAMGGKETLPKLKALDPTATVLVSSGYFSDPVMAAYEHHGFAGVVPKPYETEELARELHRVVTAALPGPNRTF